MNVKNMTSSKGTKIANQFIIQDDVNAMSGNCIEYFQSYNTMIAKRDKFRAGESTRKVWLDQKWNCSKNY